jgi:hypothetical protein
MTKINLRRFFYSSATLASIPGVLSAYEKEKEAKDEETRTNLLPRIITAANYSEEDPENKKLT